MGYNETTCNLVFDISMDFTLKAHFGAKGRLNNTQDSMPFCSYVVSRYSFWLLFLLSLLYSIYVIAAYTLNFLLNTHCA